MKHGRAKVKSF